MALRVWLPLNGNITNQGLGPQPINDGTLTCDNGKIGQCRKTGGAKFTASQSAQIFNDNGFTYCAWIYVPGEAGGAIGSPNCFFGRDGAPRIYAIFQYPKVDDLHLSWTQYNDDKSSSIYKAGIQCNDFFDVKTWVHVAVTYEPGKITVYKNGVQYATTTGTPTWSTQPGGYEYETWALTNTPNAYFNDIRVYDECLSQKQIKEISKGLVAHYKLDSPYIEKTTNLAPGIDGTTNFTINNSPAWDTTLNGTPMINPSGWGNGYNGGVTDPTHGYHAHWIRENGQWMMIFPNLNSVINQKGRWLGISSGVSTKDILAGEKYTISWWQKTDNLALAPWGGVYYKKTSDGSYNFHDGCPTFGYNTKLNTWEFMSRTFTRNAEYVQHDASQSIYVYGGNSNEGTMYVKDVQIQRGDHATPYAIGTYNGLANAIDYSGNGYNGKTSGTLIYNSDSARYSGSTKFEANCANYIWRPEFAFLTGPLTYNCWVYQTAATPTTQFIMSQGRDNTCNGFNLSCANGIPKLWAGGNDKIQITGTTSIVDSKWHMLTGTWDGTTAKLYVDGSLIGSAAMGDITYTQSSGAFVIGKMSYSYTSTANYFPFNGSISDVKIYATALSADDILTTYKNSGIIDNKQNVYSYEFKEE